MASITVENAGMEAVNGTYKYVSAGTFELASHDAKNTVYRIQVESGNDSNPYGDSVVLTQNRDNCAPITLYLTQNSNILSFESHTDDINTDWVSICGIEPIPTFTKIRGNNSNTMAKEFGEYFGKENQTKHKLFVETKVTKKSKAIAAATLNAVNPKAVLYWSREFGDWTPGIVSDINRNDTTSDEYVCVERDLASIFDTHHSEDSKNDEVTVDTGATAASNDATNEMTEEEASAMAEKYGEKLFIRIDSELIRPLEMVREHCEKRKLTPNTCVRVWSRGDTKWVPGVVTQCESGYVFVDCKEARWIQQNSCLIQSL